MTQKKMTLKEALERMLFLAEDKLARAKDRLARAKEVQKKLDILIYEWDTNHYKGDVAKILEQLDGL